MAKSKKKQNSEADVPELSFEESLTELQQIVGDLEQGELGLDESMQRFEQGISLLRNCYGVLERAEQRIEILTGTDAAGNPLTEPFDATSTIQQSENAAGRRKKSAQKKKTDEAEAADDEESDPRKRLF